MASPDLQSQSSSTASRADREALLIDVEAVLHRADLLGLDHVAVDLNSAREQLRTSLQDQDGKPD